MTEVASAASTPRLLARLSPAPRKVALLRASRIGDFICATPALRALRQALPDAEMTMITLPLLRELAERCSYVDRYAPFPGFPGLAEQLFEARTATRFVQEMQAERFDLAIQMQGSGVYSNPFTLLLGAANTAGFTRPGARSADGLLTAALPLPESGHEVERVLALSRFLGAPSTDTATTYSLWAEDEEEAARLLGHSTRPLVGLHPGGWDEERRWPVAHFAVVGRALQARFGGCLVILGSGQERERTNALAAALDHACVNLAGQTGLGTLGAVIGRLSLLLTNDSGPAHVAYALGTPTVTVAHGCERERYGPPANGPFALVYPKPPGRQRLNRLEIHPVLIAAMELLQNTRKGDIDV